MTPNIKATTNQETLSSPSSGVSDLSQAGSSRRPYIKPTMITHSGEDILDELGPAQACYPYNSCGPMA